MSYIRRYQAEYRDKKRNIITIDILKKDYTGSVTYIDHIKETAALQYRSKEGSQVVGSELTFSFVTKNKQEFAELMSSNYKDFMVRLSVNYLTVWTGWLVIDNIGTSYFDYNYTFSLSFNDGLAELDKFTITNDTGGEIDGDNSLLWYIKNSIKFNDIPMDFAIVLNTKESNLITEGTENALGMCTLSAERWKDVKSGKKEIADAKEVITEILKPFDCILFQAENKYWIMNRHESVSTIYYHNYDTLALVETGLNYGGVDITGNKFARSNQVSFIRPLKQVAATYHNKYVPSSLIPNGDFSTTDLSFWNRTGSQSGFMEVVDGELKISVANTNNNPEGAQGTVISTDPINIERKTEEDKIKVQFDYYRKNVDYMNSLSTDAPVLVVELAFQDGTSEVRDWNTLNTYKSSFSFSFQNKGTGSYTIKITDRSAYNAYYSSLEYRMDNFAVFAEIPEGKGEAQVTYDRQFFVENTNTTAIDKDEELTLKVADGVQQNDVGNLKVGGILTSKWNTWQGTENMGLAYLHLLQKLKLNQKYRNHIKLTLIADDNTAINFRNSIGFDSLGYLQESLSIRYTANYIEYDLDLVEHPRTAITYENGVLDLKSVNGESVNTVSASSTYNLPIATTEKLGGVIVGSGLEISSNGVVTASSGLPVATEGQLWKAGSDGKPVPFNDVYAKDMIRTYFDESGVTYDTVNFKITIDCKWLRKSYAFVHLTTNDPAGNYQLDLINVAEYSEAVIDILTDIEGKSVGIPVTPKTPGAVTEYVSVPLEAADTNAYNLITLTGSMYGSGTTESGGVSPCFFLSGSTGKVIGYGTNSGTGWQPPAGTEGQILVYDVNGALVPASNIGQTAYNKRISGLSITGTSTKTITITLADGTTVTGSFTDQSSTSSTSDGNDYVTGGSFNTATGEITLTRIDGGTVVFDIDGRFATPSDIDETTILRNTKAVRNTGSGNTVANHIERTSSSPSFYVDQKGTGRIQEFRSGTTPTVKAYISNDGTAYAPDFIMTSDIRLKNKFRKISGASEMLKRIETFYHKWKDKPEEPETLGVSAQQLKEVVPQVVHYSKEEDRYSVSYAKLVPLLIEANKELMKRVEELERRLK